MKSKIKNFEEVLLAIGPLNEGVKALVNYNGPDTHLLCAKATLRLSMIAKALNNGWAPNYGDSGQEKYCPEFEYCLEQEKIVFIGSRCFWHHIRETVASAFCFKSEELSDYAANTFFSEYDNFLNLPA